MITLATVVRRKPDVMTAEFDGEIVLMDLSGGAYFGLNATSSDIWRHMAEPIRVETLCQTLAGEYQGDPAVIENDILALLQTLETRALLDIVP